MLVKCAVQQAVTRISASIRASARSLPFAIAYQISDNPAVMDTKDEPEALDLWNPNWTFA